MSYYLFTLIGLLSLQGFTAAESFNILGGQMVSVYDPAPVAVSIETFTFPDYVTVVPTTAQCLANLDHVAGAPTRIRIGGTTQDRATFDPTQASPVVYTVASAGAAPDNLTYGPSFFDLASQLSGPTTFGINRRLDNISNGIQAAQAALARMGNLYAFELGNEPGLYVASDPIANNQTWTPMTDAQSQIAWQTNVSRAIQSGPLIQGGVFVTPPKFSVAELGPYETSSGAIEYVKSFSDHSYPQTACGGASTNLSQLQNHSSIVQYVKTFQAEVTAAAGLARPLFFGETNSASCGGGGISPTFGAALWIVDYIIQSVLFGYQRLYFHQGTIGNCAYCWWGMNNTYAPYYGAYFTAEALASATSIAQLDDGTTPYAAYAIYTKDEKPCKVVLINTVYHPNTTTSDPAVTFTLGNIPRSVRSAKGKLLTAPYSTSLVESGENPSYGGQTFSNDTCAVQGNERFVQARINRSTSSLSFSLSASQAMLVFLE